MSELSKLSADEFDVLARCEAVIHEGLEAFHAVGMALCTIRDSKLYREQYPTFEAYLNARWNMKRRRAYMHMDAYTKIAELPPDEWPDNEAQARMLDPLPAVVSHFPIIH